MRQLGCHTEDMTTTQMPTESVERILTAKASQLDSWTRTIQKGIKAAKRDGRTYFIGATYTSYFIDTEAGAGTKFEARPNGDVFKVAS